MSQWVFIRPRDVWMFRDSKPFSAGQNFVARSMFPPTPQTMQGVLRTHYLETRGVDFRAYAQRRVDSRILEAVGGPATNDHPADIGALQIDGPFVAKAARGRIERFYPAPLDLLWSSESKRYALLQPSEAQPDFYTEPPLKAGGRLTAAAQVTRNWIAGWISDSSTATCMVRSPVWAR